MSEMFSKDLLVRPQAMGVVNTMLLEIASMVNPVSHLTRLRHLQ